MADSGRPRSRRWLILVFVLLIFFALPIVGVVMVLSNLDQVETVEPGTTLTLHLRGQISEAPADPLLARLSGQSAVSLWGVRQGLRRAATDDRITSLLIVIEPLAMGWATVEELADEINRFRESSGKPVHAYLRVDLLEEKEYLLATAADRIWLTPGAGVLINGLAAEVIMMRGTLEKLKVEPDVIMYHEYKSAGESFKNKEMSPYFREALGAVLDDIYQRFAWRIVDRRGISEDALAALASTGMTNDDAMVEAGLVDTLGYIDEIHDVLEGLSGQPGSEYRSVSISNYAETPKMPKAPADQIAVVFGEGPIVSSSGGADLFGQDNSFNGPDVAANIREAAEDDNVKAIVFRVNSPGGSAVGSDLVWREVVKAKAKGKPVVVSMGDVAGSGGYWVSMAADRIVAHPTTITGSIGVVFQKLNFTGLIEWAGGNVETVAVGPAPSLLSFTKNLTPEQEAQVRTWMDSIYADFTEKVAEGRGLPLEKVQEIAKGRIWSGTDGHKLGLVNELGGMDTAIGLARELASLPDTVEAVTYPTFKPLFQRILEGDLNVVLPALGIEALPDTQELKAAVIEAARPQVKAAMPDIIIR